MEEVRDTATPISTLLSRPDRRGRFEERAYKHDEATATRQIQYCPNQLFATISSSLPSPPIIIRRQDAKERE